MRIMIHPQINGANAEVHVSCPTCHGTGGSFVTGPDGGTYLYHECETCGGLGVLEPDQVPEAA